VVFIDGTAFFFALPGGDLLRECYSGHNRKHALKLQNVRTPEVLFFHLFGSCEGRRHVITLYHEPGLDTRLSSGLVVDGYQS